MTYNESTENMCGRYSLFTLKAELEKRFNASSGPEQLVARYNVAPSLPMPIVIKQSPNRLISAHWGLIPAWSQEPKSKYSTINAKVETWLQRPMYQRLAATKRCLVPANGFYEWKTTSGGKQPYYIKVADQIVFAFAGLFDRWESQAGDEIYSYTILTTRANRVMKPIHDRMPVILPPDTEGIWLDQAVEPAAAVEVATSFAGRFEAWPVSTVVNNPRRDGPELIRPLPGVD